MITGTVTCAIPSVGSLVGSTVRVDVGRVKAVVVDSEIKLDSSVGAGVSWGWGVFTDVMVLSSTGVD